MVPSFEQIILDVCRNHFTGIEAIYLFGSHAKGEEGPNSDMDIALVFEHQRAKELGDLMLSDAALELARSLGCHVDMINLRLASTVFQYQVITTGKLLYSSEVINPYVFEGLIVSLYQKLKEERTLIEKSIQTSGEVYAQ